MCEPLTGPKCRTCGICNNGTCNEPDDCTTCGKKITDTECQYCDDPDSTTEEPKNRSNTHDCLTCGKCDGAGICKESPPCPCKSSSDCTGNKECCDGTCNEPDDCTTCGKR